MAEPKQTILVSGSSGFIGRAIVDALSKTFSVIGLDLRAPTKQPKSSSVEQIDFTSDESVMTALAKIRERCGGKLASVIHLAAYFDMTGEPNPKYEEITVRGTARLLRELQRFEVEQFVFASTMLVHRGVRPGERIDEQSPLDARLPYRASKIETEHLLHSQRGRVPVVYARFAGVYDDDCRNPFLAHQIARIFERSLKAHVYPADLRTGQSFLHLEDLVDAVVRVVQRRKKLPAELPLLFGEPDPMGYGDVQREVGRLIHDEDWETWEIPKPLAEAGAWAETEVLGEEPFIRPWMVETASDHYALDISRARELLSWKPKHTLRESLPRMIESLKADAVRWYETNKLDAAKVAGRTQQAAQHAMPHGPKHKKEMHEHMASMAKMRLEMLWVHFLIIALGIWLLTSPFQFALFDPGAAATPRDVTQERNLWEPAMRNAITGWSDIASGVLLILFGTLSLSARFEWAQWGTTAVGLWLLFAPLFFWTPSAAAYSNDTIVGALAVTFSVLVPMMPGMSHEGMMDESVIPPGWTYSPSSWHQRLPIIALGFFGFVIARYLAAYQLGHIDSVWEPFFSGQAGKNGTEYIITSDVSRAWPIADAGLGATSYLLEVLMGAMGAATRWRTMPWMVTFFFILVVPLGGVSIFFIIIQPIVIGTYCTLCLIAAAAMLVMIPLALDEVVAMGQYMVRSVKAGRPFLRTFLQGGPEPAGQTDKRDPGFDAPPTKQLVAGIWGVTFPWTLLASCVVGAWLMFSPAIFSTTGLMADSDHLSGAMIITIAVSALAEVGRPLRFLNVLFGLWLIVGPWVAMDPSNVTGVWNDIVCGLLIVGLSLPRGRQSEEHYGYWDRYVV